MTANRKFYIVITVLAANCFWQGYRLYAQTQITPKQIRGLGSFTLLQCSGVTGTSTVTNPDGTITNTQSDCTGLFYVDLVAADGREWKIFGGPAPAGVTLDPAHWTPVQ